jgi:3-oxoacyl-[acyl-carrier-protein] synthase II
MDPAIKPIVVTGAGVLACNGIGIEPFWNAIASGTSGIRTIYRFDVENFPSKIAGQLWDFDPADFLSKTTLKRWYRATHLALAGAIMAVEDTEFAKAGYDPERVAPGIGTSFGSTDEMYHQNRHNFETKGWKRMEKLSSSATSDHAPTATVGAHFGSVGRPFPSEAAARPESSPNRIGRASHFTSRKEAHS